jgi:hypothetical protein
LFFVEFTDLDEEQETQVEEPDADDAHPEAAAVDLDQPLSARVLRLFF